MVSLIKYEYWSIIYKAIGNFGFRSWALSNVENCPTFRQTLQLPSSGWMCGDCACLEISCRAGSRWRVGSDGADWWSGRAGCYPMGEEYVVEVMKTFLEIRGEKRRWRKKFWLLSPHPRPIVIEQAFWKLISNTATLMSFENAATMFLNHLFSLQSGGKLKHSVRKSHVTEWE
jgi:hypothetical protein